DHSVLGTRQTRVRDVTGRIAIERVRRADHHRVGRIDDWVAATEVSAVPLAAKRHGIIVSRAALDGRLHPYDATGVDIGFQRRYGCRVLRIEVSEEGVIPVEDNHPILAEIESSQIIRRKLGESVPIASDGILNNRGAPRIVCLESGELVRGSLAIGKRIINGVASYEGRPVVRMAGETGC